MFDIFQLSTRAGKETLLITPNSTNNFLYQGSLIWNVVRDLLHIPLVHIPLWKWYIIKILKLRIPVSMFDLLQLSTRAAKEIL